MKSTCFTLITACVILLSCTQPGPPPFAHDRSTPEAYLKSLESKWLTLTTTDLPDYAPDLFQATTDSLTRLRQAFDRTKKIAMDELDKASQRIIDFENSAAEIQKAIGKTYSLRNTVHHVNFIRTADPKGYYQMEERYMDMLRLAREGQLEKARAASQGLEREYNTMITNAQKGVREKYETDLRQKQKAIEADLNILAATPGNLDLLDETDQVIYRVNLGNTAWNNSRLGELGGTLEPPYFPPLPPKPGPNPPSGIGLDQITENAIRVSFTDVSDNETGNRILRTADLLNWEVVREAGVVNKFDTYMYTDLNLQPETQYCYQIETYNAEGARKSQLRCGFTLDTNHIKIWRLQLRVRIANLEDAGADNPLRVIVSTNGQYLATETFLDYGRDDFERNSNNTYDLNLENIQEISQITGLQIINHGSDQDYMFIRELELIVNGNEIFRSEFGNTNSSVLKLGYYGSFQVNHADLRAHPSWQNFIARSLSDPSFNMPDVGIADNSLLQAVISNEEIVSRIEALMGHLMMTDPALKGQFQWGEISGAPVEVTRAGANKIHVDLDVEAIVDWWPNPAVDIDFDIVFTKSCSTTSNQMTLTMRSENFTTNADYPLWKDILSLGTTKLTADVIDWYAENCTTPPTISREFSVDLPSNINCNELEVAVDNSGNVVICCFSIFN